MKPTLQTIAELTWSVEELLTREMLYTFSVHACTDTHTRIHTQTVVTALVLVSGTHALTHTHARTIEGVLRPQTGCRLGAASRLPKQTT